MLLTFIFMLVYSHKILSISRHSLACQNWFKRLAQTPFIHQFKTGMRISLSPQQIVDLLQLSVSKYAPSATCTLMWRGSSLRQIALNTPPTPAAITLLFNEFGSSCDADFMCFIHQNQAPLDTPTLSSIIEDLNTALRHRFHIRSFDFFRVPHFIFRPPLKIIPSCWIFLSKIAPFRAIYMATRYLGF